jgi:hypothetical protein
MLDEDLKKLSILFPSDDWGAIVPAAGPSSEQSGHAMNGKRRYVHHLVDVSQKLGALVP